MSRKLVIVGDSAFAEIACEYFDVDSSYEVVGFAVEQAFHKRESLLGLPVVTFEAMHERFDPASHDVHVAVVYTQLNRLRSRLAAAAKARGYALASYVSSRAFVWRNVQVGEHCFIFEDNTLQPFVRIGRNVVLWSGNHIGHHSVIHDNCFVSSHVVVSGFCEVGENCFLGVNSTLGNNVKVAADNWLGPCTTIMKDTEPGQLFRAEHTDPARVSAPRFFKVTP
jgi:sugar O-acyltransferase (sialic acid O-acetyltransferase NeuD family)